MPEPSIFDYLAKQTAQQTTITQLNDATKLTNIDAVNIKSWADMITVSRMLKDSRTFGYGLPIPETGEVLQTTIADSSSAVVKPTAPEIWRIEAIDRDSVDVFLFDGTSAVSINSKTEPFYITNTLYISYSNTAGSEKNPTIAYTKVAL